MMLRVLGLISPRSCSLQKNRPDLPGSLAQHLRLPGSCRPPLPSCAEVRGCERPDHYPATSPVVGIAGKRHRSKLNGPAWLLGGATAERKAAAASAWCA